MGIETDGNPEDLVRVRLGRPLPLGTLIVGLPVGMDPVHEGHYINVRSRVKV